MRIIRSIAVLFAVLACGGGENGPPTGNNEPVATVTINGTGETDLEIGDTRALTVTLRDAQNRTLSGRAITWTAAPAGRVSLSAATGATTTLTGVALGAVTVTATSETKTDAQAYTVVEAPDAPLTATVNLLAASFSPSSVTIKNGGTVTWTNNSGLQHNLLWDDNPPAGVDDVDPFNAGQTRPFTFNATGTFDYHCSIHGTATSGMRGSVTVVP
jgi:plastocyanin